MYVYVCMHVCMFDVDVGKVGLLLIVDRFECIILGRLFYFVDGNCN